MSISKSTSITSSCLQFMRPAIAVAALMMGAAAVHAADAAADTKGIQKEGSISSQKNSGDSDAGVNSANTQNNGNKMTGKAASDSWITTKVKSELMANSASKGLKVHVTTKSGVVSLKGKLPTQDAADLVKSIAEKVKGVQSVDVSSLTVEG